MSSETPVLNVFTLFYDTVIVKASCTKSRVNRLTTWQLIDGPRFRAIFGHFRWITYYLSSGQPITSWFSAFPFLEQITGGNGFWVACPKHGKKGGQPINSEKGLRIVKFQDGCAFFCPLFGVCFVLCDKKWLLILRKFVRVACGTVFFFLGGGAFFFCCRSFFFFFLNLFSYRSVFFYFFFIFFRARSVFFCKNGCGKIRSKMCRKPSNFVKFQDGCAFFRPLFFVFQCEQLFSNFLKKKKKTRARCVRSLFLCRSVFCLAETLRF